jgi:orotate phosphoribosyltransferase-like protein
VANGFPLLSIIANVMQEKITLYLPRATGSRTSSFYLSFSNTKYQFIVIAKSSGK